MRICPVDAYGADRNPLSRFSIAIDEMVSRAPRRHVLGYSVAAERAVRRVIEHIGLTYDILTFERRLPRNKGVISRRWFPGYLFILIDRRADRWQQLARAPGVHEVFDRPLEESAWIDLVARCPTGLMRNDDRTVIPNGAIVELRNGPLAGHRGVVSGSGGKTVQVELICFGRPVAASLATKDVLIVG
jgi:transcription antitermination factor NusG